MNTFSFLHLVLCVFILFRLPSNTYQPRTSSRLLYIPNPHFLDLWFSFPGSLTFPTHGTGQLFPSFTLHCNQSQEVFFKPSSEGFSFYCWQTAICFLKTPPCCNRSHQQHSVTSASLAPFHLPTQKTQQWVKRATEKTPFRKSRFLKDPRSLLCQNTRRVNEYFFKVTSCDWELQCLFERLRKANLRGSMHRLNNWQLLRFTAKFCITPFLFWGFFNWHSFFLS